MNPEIAALRAQEAFVDRVATEGDRLARDLLLLYACDFVVIAGMPPACWAELPKRGGGIVTESMLRRDRLPRSHRGRVGVSMEMLRWLAR